MNATYLHGYRGSENRAPDPRTTCHVCGRPDTRILNLNRGDGDVLAAHLDPSTLTACPASRTPITEAATC